MTIMIQSVKERENESVTVYGISYILIEWDSMDGKPVDYLCVFTYKSRENALQDQQYTEYVRGVSCKTYTYEIKRKYSPFWQDKKFLTLYYSHSRSRKSELTCGIKYERILSWRIYIYHFLVC